MQIVGAFWISLPITHELSVNKVTNTLEGSYKDLTCWHDMLKAFRVMLICGPQVSNKSLHAPRNPSIFTTEANGTIQHLLPRVMVTHTPPQNILPRPSSAGRGYDLLPNAIVMSTIKYFRKYFL